MLVLAGLAVYIGAARGQRRRGSRRWPHGRTAAFAAGAGLLVAAASPPVVHLAHGNFSGHMVQHLLVGMLAPLGLVLGAPVTLAFRSVSVAAARRVTGMLQSWPVRILSHPVAAAGVNVGGMYVLYLTPLYSAMLESPALHAAVHLHVLTAGCVFAWSVLAGPDPAPHPAPLRTRLGVLVVSIAAHGVLSKLMYGYGWPRGAGLGVAESQAAAELMYYGGDIAEGLLAAALFARWYRSRRLEPSARLHAPRHASTPAVAVAERPRRTPCRDSH